MVQDMGQWCEMWRGGWGSIWTEEIPPGGGKGGEEVHSMGQICGEQPQELTELFTKL